MANPFAKAAGIQASDWQAPGHFHGASTSRLFFDWAVSAVHPDQETAHSIRTLRARARDLVKNNPYATGVVDAVVDNVVGAHGIRLKPEVRGRDGGLNRRVNQEILDGWHAWGMDHASVDGVDDWDDLQRLLVATWVTDGECFIRERRGWDNPNAYALEILDADLLDETYNEKRSNGVEIRQGIEMDRNGRRLAYHFWAEHPTRLGARRERIRIPASEIIHWFQRRRPGQNRGYSLFAPALTTWKMVDGLSEAELVASRMAAAKMGFITNNTEEAIAAYADRLRMANDDGEAWEPRAMDVAPGLVEELMPGQGFEGFDPDHPNTAFEAFLKVMLRGVARAFGTSYLTLTGDVAEANYSSMRAGLIPERDHWRVIQRNLHQRVHRPVYRHWLADSLLAGALRLPSVVASDFDAHTWHPRGWDWVDPIKDLQALALGIGLGVNSRTEGAAARGRDYQAVIDEIADEEAYAEEQGVNVEVNRPNAKSDPGAGRDNALGSNENGNGNGNGAASRIAKILEATTHAQ